MTTTVRSVRVEMELSISRYMANANTVGRGTEQMADRIERGVGSANKAFAELDGNLKTVNTRLLNTEKRLTAVGQADKSVAVSVSQMNRGLVDTDRVLARVDVSGRKANSQLDTFSGRAGILLKLAAGFGPALLPIGAIGVPALAGLAAQGGLAAAAIGASVLALQGVGEGVKALEKARLDPTLENMQAAQQVVRRMGPDAAELTMRLEDLQGVREKLQASAAAGFIPGLNDSLDNLETRIPETRRLLRELGDVSGDILARGTASLTSDRWTEFFDYLRNDARPILNDTADAVGNVAHGVASIFSATSGDQQAFTGWLRETTEDFDDWASNLESNESFQDFMDYATENGPEVAEAAGAIASAIASVVEAAAPLGGPTLQILETVADVVGAIADSPLGSPLLTAVSAYSLLSTALPGVKRGYDGVVTGQSKFEAQLDRGKAKLKGASTGFQSFRTDLGTVASTYATAGARSERATNRMAAATGRLRTQIGPLVKGGAGLAGLAVATSGVADGMGLSSTASLALLGYMVGGAPGAIGGGLVGASIDLSKANSKAADSERTLSQAMDAANGDFRARTQAIDDIRQKAADQRDDVDSDSFGEFLKNTFDPDVAVGFTRDAFGLDTIDEQMDEAAAKAEESTNRIKTAIASISVGLGDTSTFEQLLPLGEADLDDMTVAADRLQPALSSLGLTFDDLGKMDSSQIKATTQDIEDFFSHADSAAGRTEAINAAIADLDNGLMSTSESAAALKENLDALLGPQLGLSAATDAWTTALRHLDDDLAKNNHTLKGNSDAAIQNRDAIRQRVSQLTDVLVAEADAGASSQDLARNLRQQRKALIDAGAAANISKSDMRDYLNTLGLTPTLVKTLIKANTGNAEHQIKGVHDGLDDVGSQHPRPKVTVDAGNSFSLLGSIRAALGGLHDKTVHVRVQREGGFGPQIDSAGGSTVPGPRYPYRDKVLAYVAPGEEIVSNSRGQADRARPLLKAINANRFADGGTPGLIGSTYARTTAGNPTDPKPGPKDPKHKHVDLVLLGVAEAAIYATKGLRGLEVESRRLEQQTKKLERRQEKAQATADALQSRYDGIVSTTVGLLTSDIFAKSEDPTNPWAAGAKAGGVMDPISALESDIANTQAYNGLVAQLKGRGLGKDALQEVASRGTEALQTVAGYTDADLARFNQLYDQRAQLVGKAATDTADAVIGPELVTANAHLQRIEARLASTERQAHALEQMVDEIREVKQAVKDADGNNQHAQQGNAQQVADGVNFAGAKGKRNRVYVNSGRR